jgi:two-component system chemotaxis response regulator CheB
VGVILTGMGRDGASGLAAMRAAGAHTIGESRASALVYGMPRVAHEEGAVCEQAPIGAVAGRIAQALHRLRAPV